MSAAGIEWGPIDEGTAVAKTLRVPVDGADDIQITPLWSDVEGVVAEIVMPDHPIGAHAVAILTDTLSRVMLYSPLM